ncbi:MAG: indole-3-glycerol phosphate synthase TrpC [Candidatus Omnitrophica bacterium]|nr:indole-3-glycerol phosphate synthase TrpC [Candidatus Omnitrophota bacterium]
MARDVLKEIINKKKERVMRAKEQLPEAELQARIKDMPPACRFIESVVKSKSLTLIAEIKKASPSQGVIREDFDPVVIAGTYREAGASALSVLTEEDFFQGSLSFIPAVKKAVTLPVLRKDFIVEPYQVYEARYFQADAILLIADLLSKDKLVELIRIAEELGLDCLVEVHTEKELKKVIGLKGPVLIGINNRDLHSLAVDFRTTERLFPLIPKGKNVVVESGIRTAQDILFLKILGACSVLIGQAFMSSPDIKAKVREIMSW